MKIDFQPESATAAWEGFFASLGVSRDGFATSVQTIAAEEQPTRIVARLLSPGRSGAKVAVISYYDSQKSQHNWVVKVVPLARL
jgi:hypothetical protein